MNREVLKYCERILRLFCSRDNWPQDIVDRFQAWLVNGEHCREKDLALRRFFYEMLEERTDKVTTTEIPDRIREIIDS